MFKLKAQKKTEKKITTEKKLIKVGFFWFLAIIVFFLAAFVSSMVIGCRQIPTGSTPGGIRAAIVDQLYTNYPNEDFNTKVTQILEDFGFEVDIYKGDDVTVGLYRNLPAYDYKLIIFRAHSGVLSPTAQDVGAIIGTYLFTNESFNIAKYTKERLGAEIAPAKVKPDDPPYFSIGPKFILNSMKGKFNNTIVVVDGCSCIYVDDLAQAFTSTGVSCYIAWSASINLDYGDKTTITLINNLCSERLPVNEAVYSTMVTEGPDEFSAVMKYYPPKSGDKTLKQLIQ